MQWFRVPLGIVDDPKIIGIAMEIGIHRCFAVAAWVYVLDEASLDNDRGSTARITPRGMGISLLMEFPIAERLIQSFRDEKMIVNDRVDIWEELYGNERPPRDEWVAIRSKVFERDGYICTYCGSDSGPLECDHIYPVSRGGGHAMENLTTSCKCCNRSKHARTVEEWLKVRAA